LPLPTVARETGGGPGRTSSARCPDRPPSSARSRAPSGPAEIPRRAGRSRAPAASHPLRGARSLSPSRSRRSSSADLYLFYPANEKAARRPLFRQAKADQPRSVVVSVAVTVAGTDAPRPAGQLDDVEAVALAVGRVDEAPVVDLEVVGHVAAGCLELGNGRGWQRHVEPYFD